MSSIIATFSMLPSGLLIDDPTPELPPGFDVFSGRILGWIKGVLIVGGLAMLAFAFGKVGLGMRRGQNMAVEGFVQGGYTLLGLTLVGSLFAIAGFFV